MLKVLFVSEVWYPYGGGGEITLHELLKQLTLKGIKVYIITTTGPPNYDNADVHTLLPKVFQKALHCLKFRSFSFSQILRLAILPLFIFQVAKVVIKERVKIIHAFPPVCSIASLAVTKLLKRKVIVSIRHYTGERWFLIESNRFKAYLMYILERVALSLPYDKIIAFTSEFLMVANKIGIPQSRLVYFAIPNAVDTKMFNPNVNGSIMRAKLSIASNSFIILYAGAITKAKGIQYLIKAFKKVHYYFPNTTLVLVGEGEDRKYFNNLVNKLGLGSAVLFVGKISYEEMPYIYACADVFVLPSLTEVSPRTILEAMACGKPVVATYVGGVPDLIDNYHSGVLVEPANDKQLVKSLNDLISKPNFRKMLSKNATKIATNYTWDNFAKQYIQIFNTVLEQEF